MSKDCCGGLSLIPCKLDICYYNGDSFKVSIGMDDCDGNFIDLTDADISIHIKKTINSPVLVELSIGDGISISGENNNIIEINKVIDLPQGTYRWDLQIIFPDGTVRTVFAGQFKVQTDITT